MNNNNNGGLENITKYLLNYLFKKIDDLTARNVELEMKLNRNKIEEETERRVMHNLTQEAFKMAKDLGMIKEDGSLSDDLDVDNNEDPRILMIKKKKTDFEA